MKGNIIDWLLALAGGLLLALMLDYNGIMAKHSTPLFSALVLHGVGTIASLFFLIIFVKILGVYKQTNSQKMAAPLWAYLGGIPGALGVLLAGTSVNTRLGLAGTFAFMLTGQILFGVALDVFGLFGHAKRKLVLNDFFVMCCALKGSVMIIYFGS